MKKLSYLLCAAVALFFAGCAKTQIKRTEINDGNAVILIPDSDFNTLEEYITSLKADGELSFEGEKGEYGLFITSFDGRANEVISSTAHSSKGYSWTVYTDFTELDGVLYAGDSETAAYGGVTLYKAVYGVSSLPCKAGRTYAFVYEYYEYEW